MQSCAILFLELPFGILNLPIAVLLLLLFYMAFAFAAGVWKDSKKLKKRLSDAENTKKFLEDFHMASNR